MIGAFADVRWERIIAMGLVLGCVYRLYFWKRKVPVEPRGFIDAILLGVAWMVVLILVHASPVTIEIGAAVSLGLVLEALLSLIWRRKAVSESGAKGLESHGPSSGT